MQTPEEIYKVLEDRLGTLCGHIVFGARTTFPHIVVDGEPGSIFCYQRRRVIMDVCCALITTPLWKCVAIEDVTLIARFGVYAKNFAEVA